MSDFHSISIECKKLPKLKRKLNYSKNLPTLKRKLNYELRNK